MSTHYHCLEVIHVVVPVFPEVIGESGRQQTAGQIRCTGYGQTPTVQKGALSLLRNEQFIQHRVEHSAEPNRSFALQGDGDAEDRIGVGIVRRPVKRIDDPTKNGSVCRLRRFFRQDAVFRETSPDPTNDQLLGKTIGLGDQVDVPLVFDRVTFINLFPEEPTRL